MSWKLHLNAQVSVQLTASGAATENASSPIFQLIVAELNVFAKDLC